ncbi:hypothetical protein P3G55_12010 [Leptospira sp. 96542]|nr:hypothetical protein [Leptospira sp. 96542]
MNSFIKFLNVLDSNQNNLQNLLDDYLSSKNDNDRYWTEKFLLDEKIVQIPIRVIKKSIQRILGIEENTIEKCKKLVGNYSTTFALLSKNYTNKTPNLTEFFEQYILKLNPMDENLVYLTTKTVLENLDPIFQEFYFRSISREKNTNLRPKIKQFLKIYFQNDQNELLPTNKNNHITYLSLGSISRTKDIWECGFYAKDGQGWAKVAETNQFLSQPIWENILDFACGNSYTKYGSTFILEPKLVCEIFFETIIESKRRKAGFFLHNAKIADVTNFDLSKVTDFNSLKSKYVI